jgi:hypothetical protein
MVWSTQQGEEDILREVGGTIDNLRVVRWEVVQVSTEH